MEERGVIAIGASAGGVEALQHLVHTFPADLSAAVFVVLHLPATGRSFLADVLNRRGPLPAAEAEDGAPFEPGHIYVARNDYHLLIAEGHMHLSRGPKEGRQRPCINVTFRSAAMSYGEHVIGVVLTGMLDDGTAGLWEIKQHGGIAVVQDPDEAASPSMPTSALQEVQVDYKCRLVEIGPLLGKLTTGAGSLTGFKENLSEGTVAQPRFTGWTCPDCRGPIWQSRNRPAEFRCRVGHVYSSRSYLDEHVSTQERKLYEAVLALEEGADLSEYMAARVEPEERDELMHEASRLRSQARTVRALIEERRTVPV